ncbi:hypothetical protein [Amnibacterium kyonggiense]
MIAALRRRLRHDPADRGIALIELIVSMVVTLIMLTLIARMFAQVTHSASDNQSTRAGIGIAGTAMDEITRVVRQGTRVSTSQTATEGAVVAGSTASSLSIDSFVDATVTPGLAAIAPTRVVFSVDGSGSLIEQRYAGTVANGYVTFSGSGTSRTVNGPIDTSGSTPLFAYADGSGTAVVPGATGLTSAQALSVASVTVTVTVDNQLSSGNDPVQLTNEVTMPNIAILNGGY